MPFADPVVEVKDSLDSYFEVVAVDILEVAVGILEVAAGILVAVVDILGEVVAGNLVGYSLVEKGILVAAEDSHHSWVVEPRSLDYSGAGLPM